MRLYTVSPSDVGPGKFGSQALEKAFWASFFPHFPINFLKAQLVAGDLARIKNINEFLKAFLAFLGLS